MNLCTIVITNCGKERYNTLMAYIYKPRKPVNYILYAKRYKDSVRHRVAYALKVGQLTKLPCEYADCNILKVEAHHPDYSEPLDVIWLCRDHHLELHRHLSTPKR